MKSQRKLQIGKSGLTPEFIEQVKKVFENAELIRISILKSACRDKEHAKEMGDELVDSLGKNFTFKLIGYVLVVRKWRRAIRS